jgi:hypothetical protein
MLSRRDLASAAVAAAFLAAWWSLSPSRCTR